MSTADLGGRLALLERYVGAGKANVTLSLEGRIDLVEKSIDQLGLNIEHHRRETATRSAVLEKRIKGLQRLLVFVAEVPIALVAVVAAGICAGYLGSSGWLPSGGAAAFAFLVAFLGANILFRKIIGCCRG